MARSTMANPLLRLREMCAAGSADVTVNGVAYWTDDQLQATLDQHRVDIFSERLEDVATYNGSGTALYYDYYCTPGDYEEGTATFQITNSLGSVVTPDSVNYQIGHISFGTVNQQGTAYYLTGRRFDLNGAAADVWRRKAAQVAMSYSFTADGQTLNRNQMIEHCKAMVDLYASQAEPIRVEMRRGDSDY